jgi:hypothetical protein
MDLPRLTVCITTTEDHDQNERGLRAIRTTLSNLRYSGPLLVHIADGGSSQDYRRLCLELAASFPTDGYSVSNGQGRGYGASHNLALQQLHALAGIFLMVEDDYELVRPLDLDVLVPAFFDKDWVGCIRLAQLEFPTRGQVVDIGGLRYLNLDQESKCAVWTHAPRLETRRFQREQGEWPEGVAVDKTRASVARKAREGILWPLDLAASASASSSSLFVPQGGHHAEGISVPTLPGA